MIQMYINLTYTFLKTICTAQARSYQPRCILNHYRHREAVTGEMGTFEMLLFAQYLSMYKKYFVISKASTFLLCLCDVACTMYMCVTALLQFSEYCTTRLSNFYCMYILYAQLCCQYHLHVICLGIYLSGQLWQSLKFQYLLSFMQLRMC